VKAELEEDEESDEGDIQMIIERQSSAKESNIDYFRSDEPKKSKQ